MRTAINLIRRIVRLTVPLGLLVWTAVNAAEQPPVTPRPGETPKVASAPSAIPASEIIPRAEQTLKRLQEMSSQVEADPVLGTVESAFPGFAERSERWWKNEGPTVRESASVPRLSDTLREWRIQQEQVESWQRALSDRSLELSKLETELGGIIESWKLTSAAATKEGVPKAVLERVAEVVRELETTRKRVQRQITRLLNLQDQVASQREVLGKIRKQIDQAREESGRRLFTLDSPPIWQALSNREDRQDIVAQTGESASMFADDARDFVMRYRERLLWHIALFLGMAAALYLLRRNLRETIAATTGGAAACYILDRPLSSSLLLAVLLTPWLYFGAATEILRIAIVPTVVPVMRLVPGLLPAMLRRGVYFFVGLYVLDFLLYYIPSHVLLVRVLHLLIGSLGVGGLSAMLRSVKKRVAILNGRQRALLAVVRCSLALFGVSVAANIVGSVSLAEFLVSVPLRITYIAVLLFTGGHLVITLGLLALQSPPALLLRSVRDHGDFLARRLRGLVRFAAITLWVVFSLNTLGILEELWSGLVRFRGLTWSVGAADISVQGVVAFLLVLLTAIIVSRIVRFVLAEEIFPRVRLARGVPGTVELFANYGILLLGFLIALAAAGVELSKVTLLLSALGVGIGFGLQNVVNNFVSGLILVFEHPIQVGDMVEIGTVLGEVRKIGYRASVVRTFDGAEVIIPNGELVGSKVINWSLSDRLRRIDIVVGAAYGTEVERVIEILLGVARNHREVLTYPAPEAFFENFGDSSLDFRLRCWTRIDIFLRVKSELTIAINNAFKESGIQIPFPQRDLHVRWPDGSVAANSPERPHEAAPAEKTARDQAAVLGRSQSPKA